jgi:hypothetical protein
MSPCARANTASARLSAANQRSNTRAELSSIRYKLLTRRPRGNGKEIIRASRYYRILFAFHLSRAAVNYIVITRIYPRRLCGIRVVIRDTDGKKYTCRVFREFQSDRATLFRIIALGVNRRRFVAIYAT